MEYIVKSPPKGTFILYWDKDKYDALTPDQKAIYEMRRAMVHAACVLEESPHHEYFKWLSDKLQKDAYKHEIPSVLTEIK